jgi:carbamoyl-phosphate synthase large subunit
LKIPNLTGRKDLGSFLAISSGITQGEISTFTPVLDACRRIAEALGSRGPLNIQGRWDGSNFMPFEINPRFSGTTSMRAMAGFNEPVLLIRSHRNKPMRRPKSKVRGVFSRRLIECFDESRRGGSSA